MISLRHVNRKEIVLRVGDVVNRHIMDGDIVLFNRQPTLHRMSMMGHRVKVLPYNTFRLNVSVTAPYNADFDGDEMNAHIPQSYESATELLEIAAVPHQIVTPRHAKPVIGIVQDTLVGSYRITRSHVSFNRREFMNMMMWNRRFEGVVPKGGREKDGKQRWSGQQILSQLLPPINMDMGNGMYKDNKVKENFVRIREGEIQEGIFDKDIFSKPSKGIIHTVFKDYGSTDTVNFIDAMQNTVEQFLVYNGFSVGVSDLIADEDTRKQMEEVIKKRKVAIEDTLLQIHMDLFDNNTGKSNRQEFEDKVYGELNKATEEAGKIGLGSLSDENRLVAMVRAGSKGSTINIAQMMACVGQQAPEGRRIPYGFTDRTLPHYKKYDDGAEARGFVESSFIEGLTPQEFFFHAMSGREGLIDTAVKTADTGYIQRQLVKAMEDLTTQYDGTVRDSRMNILQFQYGEDGINATKIESANLGIGKLSEEEILKQYGMTGVDIAGILEADAQRGEDSQALAEFAAQIVADRKMLVEGIQRMKQDAPLFASVNLERVLMNVSVSFKLGADKKTDLTPLYVIAGIDRLIQRTQTKHSLWAALLRYYLSPHKIIVKDRLTKKAFDTACEMILVKNWQSWVQPGEQVGIIAAQSIGEPSTQMTLNSVDWDTKIMIAKNGQIVCTDIGEFVDTQMAAVKPEAIQRFANDQLYLDLNDGNDWQAISCDEDGQMVWTKLEAVTRHPVVNEDGTNTILEVMTASGRTVKGTKGKSFLKLVDGKIVGVNGSDLQIGDCLPIANSLAVKTGLGLVDSVPVREHLPPTEWLYGTDAQAALAALNGTDRHWFQKNNGTVFTVPYSRSDTFRDAFVDGRNTNAAAIKPGFVYPARTRPDISQIPEKIALTESFGFFVGAYLAEGSSNATQVNITNNDPTYLERVQALMKEWNVGTHGVSEQREALKTGIKGTTTSLVIHSTLIAALMQRLFGRVSHEKTLPDWVFQAPDEFVQGLVDGYVSGDGSVEKGTGCVKATSVSKVLLVRFGTLFARYGIFSTMSERTPELGVFDSVRTNYTMYIPVKYSAVFAKTFRLTIPHKQEILNHHFVENTTERKCRRDTTGDMVWDSITSIKEVVPIKNLVYDLTVEGTRNFMTHSCLAVKDTFHLAGVAAKSNVTRGVPRLKELLKVTQNPKAISLTVYLKPEFRSSKDRARQVAQDLELTLLKDITVKTAIYFDPKDAETIVEEDADLIEFYKLFEEEEDEGAESTWSAWLLRFELDRDRMFRKNISMDDVSHVLRSRFGESLNLIYSDYNSNKLIMRMRLPAQMKNGLDDLSNLKKFQNRILNGIVFRGVPGIKSVTFREDKDMLELVDGVYKEVQQYVLDTDGSNYLEVMNHPYVDATRLSSSHVHDIYDILGIEATRAVLLHEITTLFEEAGVNNRHLGLLCDVMTRGGRLMPSNRHGVNKTDIGPLAKASFEETEKILLNAALFGEMDPVTGVSANIMTGQVIRGGTGFFNVLLDEGAFMRLQEGLAPVEGYDEEDDAELTQEQIDKALYEDENDMCSSARLRMNITMPNPSKVVEEPDMDVVVIDRD
jgi:DNA-directed RNA polymerase beta' subunit